MPTASSPSIQVQEYREAGRVEIVASLTPLSLQAKGGAKSRYQSLLRDAVSRATVGVFLGDVEVSIEWFVNEATRYGTHLSADIDNIVKPILDAIAGPGLIMIDDGQVQSLRVSWLDPAGPELVLRVNVQALSPEQFFDRDGLVFLEFSPARCFPLLKPLAPHAAGIVEAITGQLQAERTMLDEGFDPFLARSVLPIQRFFPRSRLRGFEVRSLDSLDAP